MNGPLGTEEEHFRALADSAPVLIWMSDLSMGGIYFNRAWLDFTGRSPDREAGDGWRESLHPDDLVPLEAAQSAFRARQPFQIQFRLRRHDGVWRWMLNSGKPRYSPAGEFTGYTGSCVDITERFEAEEEARRQLRVMRDGLRHAAVCPAPSHMECPTFRRLLRVAAAGKMEAPKKTKKSRRKS